MIFRKKILFSVIMIIMAAAASFGLAELMVRVLVDSASGGQITHYVTRAGFYAYSSFSTQSFINERGQRIVIKTDENGLRNRPGTLAQSTIVLLGDSFILAANTPEELTLSGRLKANGIKVYNAGMDGYGTFESLSLLRQLLDKTPARTIILAFYLGNDFRDNYFSGFVASDAATPEKISAINLFLQPLWQHSKMLIFL